MKYLRDSPDFGEIEVVYWFPIRLLIQYFPAYNRPVPYWKPILSGGFLSQGIIETVGLH